MAGEPRLPAREGSGVTIAATTSGPAGPYPAGPERKESTMTDTTPQELLDLPLPGNDSGADTVRGYLVALLAELWREGEGFSGKRPFGNSGWQYDLYGPMVKAGIVPGTLDEDGFLDDLPRESERKASELVAAAIASLCNPAPE